MKVEHVAFNVADPVAVAAWDVEHLGLEIARHIPVPTQTHFLPVFRALRVKEQAAMPVSRFMSFSDLNPHRHLAIAAEC